MTGKKVVDYSQGNRVRDLLLKLSLEQKVSLLAGQDRWHTQAIPEQRIPSLKVTNGPNGARGEFFTQCSPTDGTPAAFFPCGISLAATWNTELLHSVGGALSLETKAKQAQALLAPTVCMHRSPLGGRNFESFSEDPYLTGKMSAAYINGLQEGGVGATIKHYVANEQETWRKSVDSVVEERPLREIYLKPFEIAIREANPWAIMSSHNLINGHHADMNKFVMRKVLRGEWKFEGLVMSDWGGINSTVESIKAGVDLEMPGPSKLRGQKVLEAIKRGELTLADIEECAARVLFWIERCGRFELPVEEPQEKAIDTKQTRDLIRQAGIEGITLLKNDNNILPIGSDVRRIALIGPNVKQAIAGGGGSSNLKPYYLTTPFDSISTLSGKEIVYAQGAQTDKWLPLASNVCTTPSGRSGVLLEFYKGDRFEGKPVSIQNRPRTDLFLWDNAPKEVLPEYSFRVRTVITPETSGNHTFGLSSVGPAKMYVNGNLLIDNWDWTEVGEAMFDGSIEVNESTYLEAGKRVEILVESTNEVRPASNAGEKTHGYGGCRIGYTERSDKEFIAKAAEVAASADVAVVIVGLDAEWESQGYDRQTMDLPKDGNQDRLIAAVAKANPRTVVVNQSGTPVSMPWADDIPAIVQAWYQGQEAGNALADVLLGLANPSGKLPVTFPKRLEDNPAYHNWPGEHHRVVYGEGIYIGYRHYELAKLDPQFVFGHGLSYTTFEYGQPTINGTVLDEFNTLTVSVPVTNTGSRAGKESVQLYIHDPESRLPRPVKELQAFGKVHLEPNQTKIVDLKIDKYSVGYYDTSLSGWIAEEGEFEAIVGASSADIKGTVPFQVEESFSWVF